MSSSASKKSAFFAYASTHRSVGACIEGAVSIYNRANSDIKLTTWKENDISGRPLTDPILEKIKTATFVAVDVMTSNLNVTYEAGYAIGSGVRLLVTKDKTIQSNEEEIQKVGIFDTLGYTSYSSDQQLASMLIVCNDLLPSNITFPSDINKPIYVLQTPYAGDSLRKIISAVKRARYGFRSFNPAESSRLSATDAIEQVVRSHGVIVPWLTSHDADNLVHNMRAAFVSGLAHALNRPTLCLIEHGATAPLDLVDRLINYKFPDEIQERIADWIPLVAENIQTVRNYPAPKASFLREIRLGDPMAENEIGTIGGYYLDTDNFDRARRGEVSVVVGRKGSGKTALWIRLRDVVRNASKAENIVVDLKPEGYQLLKLRENVIDYLSEGAQSHLIQAFWEYLILLEIAYKILEKDEKRHLRDHRLTSDYIELQKSYESEVVGVEGDFSERFLGLSRRLEEAFRLQIRAGGDIRLSNNQVTELLYKEDIKQLRKKVFGYLEHKSSLWVLFDNLDKGWSLQGISNEDYLMLRCLIDAGRKLQNDLRNRGVQARFMVFVRDDVYQTLCEKSPDFGKDLRASLDWRDADLLREVLRRRMVKNGLKETSTFQEVWSQFIISHIDGEETSQYLIDRSLMRPRNLLKLLSHCKGSAINYQHERIEEGDIRKGMSNYAVDLVVDADQELADVLKEAEGLIYFFEKEGRLHSRTSLTAIMSRAGVETSFHSKIIEFFLYYGLFGIRNAQGGAEFICDVGYNMKRLSVLQVKAGEQIEFVANPAFWDIFDRQSQG